MAFFSLLPRFLVDVDKRFRKKHYYHSPLTLKVVQDNGFEVTPLVDIQTIDLSKSGKTMNYFNSNKSTAIKFKIDVILGLNERWDYGVFKVGGKKKHAYGNKRNLLRKWITDATPVFVRTKAMDIPNGLYLITGNPSRKQRFNNYAVWTLEFTTYTPLTVTRYANDNKYVNMAINKANGVKSNNNNSKKFPPSTLALSKCKTTQLVYSKNKKNVACVRTMQWKLYTQGFLTKKQINGWYNNVTANAVKKFQKKYKLKQTGKIDASTYLMLLGV